MQFIPELLKINTGYFRTEDYEFAYDDKDTPLIEGTHYTVEYNENYTEFVLTINNPSQFTAANGKPAAFWLSYSTTILNDGATIYNVMRMSANDQVLSQRTFDSKTESEQKAGIKTTTGGTITIDTSYSITLYKVDESTLKPLPGAVFKVTTPSGEEITLDATDEDGRTQSRQFTSAEAASGDFTIVEVTAPDGYILDTTPIEVTIGQSGVIKTITNKQYEATGSITLEGTKKLTGRDLNDGEFTFTVKEGTEVVATGKNDATGKITFSEIEYDLEDVGTHTYIITEDSGNISGVEYSKESYTVTVTVVDDGEGKLIASVDTESSSIQFRNTYTPPTTPSVPSTPSKPSTPEKPVVPNTAAK